MDGKNAQRSDEITDEMWNEINPYNREIVQEFLDNQSELAIKTKIGYESGLRIFFYWVKEHLHDKNFNEIKKKEFVKYLNWLTNRGLSDSAIKFKKSCVSSFCNYIMMMYEDEMPEFRNFTSGLKVVKTGYVHEKQPLTPDELQMLYDELEKREEWEKLAYVLFSYSTGCRRAEARQLLKEVIDYEPIVKTVTIVDDDGKEVQVESKSYKTHQIRAKGRSRVGKVRQFLFGEDAMNAIKKWLEVRGEDDCPYVFVIKQKNDGSVRQVAEETFNGWCHDLFSKIMNRRINPHCFRMSRATNLVCEHGRPIETAQKLLGHESSETTQIYVIREDLEDANDAFV